MSLKLEIVDNFLSNEDLQTLQSLKLKETKDGTMNVYVKKINEEGMISGTGIEDNTASNLQKGYHLKALEILKKLYPEKADLYEYSEFGITDTGTNYNYPIHNDTPNKLLSGVIFLSPDKSEGTKFYDNKKGDGLRSIDWKINRGVFFSRHENLSWHSFNNGNSGVRRVLVYNLMTSDIKTVCKIENVNFYFSRFKHLVNPYLYKYFNLVI
tara:strand:+ start:7490 stop:8122 length:633 start_codon:yes stop_codon:yes gene_type:complete